MKILSEREIKEAAAKGRIDRAVLRKQPPKVLEDVVAQLSEAVAKLTAASKSKAASGPTLVVQDNKAVISAVQEALSRIQVGAPPPAPYKPPDYEFTIHRDMNGRIEAVSAHAVPAN